MLKIVELKNGNTVRIFSFFPFTLEQIADVLRPVVIVPVKKTNKFMVILPWIIVALLTIGLGVSGYFNWKQDQSYEYLKESYDQMQSSGEQLSGDYYAMRDKNDSCEDKKDSLEQNVNQLQQQVNDLETERGNTISALINIYDKLDYADDEARTTSDRTYSILSDLLYNNVSPEADALGSLNDYAISSHDAVKGAYQMLDDLLSQINQ